MTFEIIWAKIKGLPDTAKWQIPEVLKTETKMKLSRMSPEQIKEIVEAAIDEVNHGSVELLDTLIKRLRKFAVFIRNI